MRLNTPQDYFWLPCGGCHLLSIRAAGLQNRYPFDSALVHAINFLFLVPLHEHAVEEADRNICTSEFSHLLLHFKTGVRGDYWFIIFFYYEYGLCLLFQLLILNG